MDDQPWQRAHRAELEHRFARLRAMPDGTIYESFSGIYPIRLVKHVGQLYFFFLEPATGALVGPMSRIELARPLALLAEYTQLAMLPLLWRPNPARVCVLGLAGGRMSLVLYHCFPSLVVDNVDLDPAVGRIAEEFFGLTVDERQRIHVADARAFLETSGGPSYDLIVMDAFSNSDDNLDHLATAEFYEVCRGRLLRGGVMCANMLVSDPQLFAKIGTFLASFRHCYAAEHKRGLVLLGNDYVKLSRAEIDARATALEQAHGFEFPLAQRAEKLLPAREIAFVRDGRVRAAPLLRDERKDGA